MRCLKARWIALLPSIFAIFWGCAAASASTLYSLTPAEQNYSFLSANLTLFQPPSVTGNAGLFTGGLLTISKNTFNGEVDFAGAQNDSLSGGASVSGGEFANVAQVGTAESDAQALAATIAALSGNAIADITSSQTLNAGVYDLANLNLGMGDTLTLNATSATDQFVVRISGTLSLGANAQIAFTGPVNPDNVLFYYTGSSGVTFGGGPTVGSIFQGILLDNSSTATDFSLNTHDAIGPSDGRLFNLSGGGISFDSGTWNGTGGGSVQASAPEPATWMLALGGLALLAIGRLRKA